MIIAVNTRLNKETQPEGYEDFMFSILGQLAVQFPQQQFLFISDAPFNLETEFAKNVQLVVAGPKTGNSLRLQYWFNYKIPALLRKHKADVFLSMEGICSLRTKIPQCLLIPSVSFLQAPLLMKKGHARFYKKFTSAFLAKAKAIATVSEYSKKILVDKYNLNSGDVTVVHPGIDKIFQPVGWEEKELIREKYADGKAYFICSGGISQLSNLINLLKAFSFFKKRQKSNMMLLIAGNTDEAFKKELKTYKFRDQVQLLESLDKAELAKITAAAYALVYPVLYADFAIAPLQAVQCQVPVLLSNAGALLSIFGDSALYINPDDFKDIAEKLMLVYKDEGKANELVKAGNELLLQYQPDKTADLLMQCIQQAINS
jgi:glycosyltransferase involved in cell wall biosynthesis